MYKRWQLQYLREKSLREVQYQRAPVFLINDRQRCSMKSIARSWAEWTFPKERADENYWSARSNSSERMLRLTASYVRLFSSSRLSLYPLLSCRLCSARYVLFLNSDSTMGNGVKPQSALVNSSLLRLLSRRAKSVRRAMPPYVKSAARWKSAYVMTLLLIANAGINYRAMKIDQSHRHRADAPIG